MPETKLKPCPFCGGMGVLNNEKNRTVSFVKCLSCGAETGLVRASAEYCSDDKVIEAWNRRAENETDVEAEPVKHGEWKHYPGMNSKCSGCGRYFPVEEFESRPFDINYCPNCGAKMDGGDIGT